MVRVLQVERCTLLSAPESFWRTKEKSSGNKTACNFDTVLVIQTAACKYEKYRPIADVR